MIDIAQPQVKSIENSGTYGKFEIEPLEPGFGTTLGNALRRVLLSTLKGAAVTSVSIEGVAHEFSSIPYVKEDVTEIILNLKGLNLEVWTDVTIVPDQAISEAAKQFTSHLGLFTRFTERIKDADVPQQKGNDLSSRLADVPIEDLDLSVRALNCLKANEITKVGQLVALREEDLLSLRNFGRKSLDEIKEKLVQRGFLTPEELTKVLV